MAADVQSELSSRQKKIVRTVAAIQFVNILDFVMMMPLGPELQKGLGISAAHVGTISGAYTLAAFVSGIVSFYFVDRFERKRALLVALVGLGVGTLLGAFSQDIVTLLLARAVAGFFGGPATSLAFAIIADTVPNALRGRAIGTVIGAFSVATVVGVPLAFFGVEYGGFRTPFYLVGALALIVAFFATRVLPSIGNHLKTEVPSLMQLLSQANLRWSYLMTSVTMAAGFIIIPNMASYLQFNKHVHLSMFKWVYIAGGMATVFSSQLGGRWVDRFGSFRVAIFGALGAIVVLLGYFARPEAHWSIFVVFIVYMMGNSFRNVAHETVASKVPTPEQRGGFQSIQSSVRHLGSTLGAMGSSLFITDGARVEGHVHAQLSGMPNLARVAAFLTFLVPLLILNVERRVKRSA